MKDWIIMLTLVAGLCCAAAAGTNAAATAPAAAAAAEEPADPAAAEDDEERIPRALLESARQSLVVVEYWFQKDQSDPAASGQDDWRMERIYNDYVDQKRPKETVGLVLDGKGHVLVVEPGIEDRFLKKVVVVTRDGARLPARRARLLLGAPGVLLKVEGRHAGKLRPARFAEVEEAGVDTSLLAATLARWDEKLRVAVGQFRPSVDYRGEDDNVYFSLGFYGPERYWEYGEQPAYLIADEDGRPVGCDLLGRFDLHQRRHPWRGPTLREADALGWKELSAAREKVRRHLIAATKEIVLLLHPSEAGQEVTSYGYAISPTELLVPEPIDSKSAAQIDKIFVRFSPQDRRPAEFVGAYKDIGGFVVRLTEDKLPAHLRPAEDDPAELRPLWVASPRKRFGKTYVDLKTNRIYGKSRGYAGKYHWGALRELSAGNLLVDLDGRIAGLYVRQRLENEEARQFQRSPRRYYGRGGDDRVRVFLVSGVRDELAAPAGHMDPKIKVKTRTEAKRRNWFGVEFVGMNRDLAEHFKIEKPTRDGQIGFLINAVYPHSPAEKAGVQVGDVLLRIQAPGMPYPIPLRSEAASSPDYGDHWRYRQRFMREAGMNAPPGALWKDRRTFLTAALDAIGSGRTVKLTYLSRRKDGVSEEVTVNYAIEQAPPDQSSAGKWKNRKIGLTVKDLTYEVRLALNLKDDAPGVVVSRIESGSPVSIARIYPNELITAVDERPVTSARQLRDAIAAAKEAGREKVRLTVMRLGATRFADLTVKAYDAEDDEGLEEGE
jgi:hypothetical protein